MFGYIKEQINAQRKSVNATTPEMQPADVPNELITEYAHLFQELDDISEEGIDAGAERKLDLDIDLNGDGDVEVETIEIGLDGNLKDIPGDATAPSVTTEYETMKTYDKFYAEAAERIPRMPRESDAAYDKRVSVLADKMYEEYCVDAEEIGAFGFSKMSITDDRVPDRINVNLGSMQDGSNAEFVTKVPVYFATDNNDHQITKKQLDSVRLVQGGALKNIGSPLKTYMESTYNMPEEKSVWDYCTPSALYVPKGNGDSFCVVLEYTNEITGAVERFGWTQPVVFQESVFNKNNDDKKKTLSDDEAKKYILSNINDTSLGKAFKDGKATVELDSKSGEVTVKTSDGATAKSKGISFKIDGKVKKLRKSKLGNKWVVESADIDQMEKVNMESFVSDIYEWKTAAEHDIAHEAAKTKEAKPKRRLSRFFQEGIDIGTGDAGSDTDNAGGDPPALDESSSDQAVDTGASSDAAPADNPQPDDGGESKETAAVNDVSDQIAEKVADQTKADATGDEDITFSDEDNAGSTDDSSVSFDSSEPTGDETASVEDQLDDLDNTAAENDDLSGDEEGMEDDGSIENGEIGDIENMSMEEIMNNASDKLKTMPLNELKEFLNGNSASDFQEAFILTKKNINKEVDVHIRKALGILNDNRMNIDKLLSKFKFEGRALNRVLVKAAKTSAVYSSDEQEAIKKLNSALSELLASLKKTNDASYVSAVKRKIGDFTKQSKIVAAFVEDKMEKPVQEGFVQEGLFLSSSNVKKRLSSKIPPVHADLMEIVRAHETGKLTKGKIMKMYKPHKTDYQKTTGAVGTNSGSIATYGSTTVNKSYEVDTIQMDHLHSLLKIVGKILRKSKVQVAFNSDEMTLIDNLGESLDDFIDYLESLIIDTSDNKGLVDQVGKDAKAITEILSKVYNFCTSLDSIPSQRRYEGEDMLGEPEGALEGETEMTAEEPDLGADEAVEETPDTDATDATEDTDSEEPADDDSEDKGNDSEEDDE